MEVAEEAEAEVGEEGDWENSGATVGPSRAAKGAAAGRSPGH